MKTRVIYLVKQMDDLMVIGMDMLMDLRIELQMVVMRVLLTLVV